jgi:hypothetical protein
MSEQNASYGGTAVATPPAAPPPTPEYDDTAANANRNKLLAVGAAAGVLVLLIVAFFLMKGGGGADTALGNPPPAPPAASGGDKVAHPAKDGPVTLPRTYKHAVGRDPFKALYVAPVQAAPKASKDGTDNTVTDPNVLPPVVSVPPTGSTTGSTGSSTGTTSQPPTASYAPIWIALEKVDGTTSATFLVGYSNGKKQKQVSYTVEAPKRALQTQFASVFALLSIQDGTATVQFGDATPFDLLPGFGNRHFVG